MRRTAIVTLLAVLFLIAFGAQAERGDIDRERVDKDAFYTAVDAWEAGAASDAQIRFLKSLGYRFGAGAGNELDNMGGPDDFGYIWKDSEEADGPTYSWVEISDTGTDVSDQMNDDNHVGPFDIGFDFPFYGQSYSQFYIQSNGLISFFDDIVWYFDTGPMPNPDYGAMIAWFWDDLDPDNPDFGGDIGGWTYYETTTVDGQDALVVEFLDYEEFPQGGDVPQMTAEMILFADGTVKLQYMNVDDGWDIDGGTIGIQNEDGSIGLTALSDGSIPGYPYNELAMQFYMADPDASVSGYVYDNSNNMPIAGADVTIGPGSATTDGSGFYEIADVYSGTADYEVDADGYFADTGTVTLSEGANTHDFYLDPYGDAPDVLIWDADPTPGSAAAIQTILEDLGFSTFYTTQYDETEWEPYENVFVFLGIYSNYYPIYTGDPEETVMVNYLNSGGNLYIEGGDIFGFNSPENLMNMLNLTDIADGSADLSNVMGYDGTWMEGADMTYAGENSWIDHINASNDATDLLYNPSDNEGCGVVDNSMEYQTACFSFEVGNLVDGGEEPNTREYLIAQLMEFWGVGGGGLVELTLTPTNAVIPPEGGTVTYDAHLVSNIPNAVPGVSYWTDVITPDGNAVGPLMMVGFAMPPYMDVNVIGMSQNVPSFAPGGTYEFFGHVGYPGIIEFADSFEFEKIGAAADGVDNWDAAGWRLAAGEAPGVSAELPDEYEMGELHPNPFNPTANVRISLPQASELTVRVYNVTGRQVAELVNGHVAAGAHKYVLDGSGLASGVYFVHATVPGELDAVRKITLMK
ncbi:MAG: hypothetical protein MAG453_02085 [Calditrichaeota bacterium]|nr:hypothetical protein [Calditrichota bacterium]